MQLTCNQVSSSLFLVQQASVEGTCGGWWAGHGSVWMHQSPCSDLPGQAPGWPPGPRSQLRAPGTEGPPIECSRQELERVMGLRGGGHAFSAQERASPPINKCVHWVWFEADEKAPKVLQSLKTSRVATAPSARNSRFRMQPHLAPERRLLP